MSNTQKHCSRCGGTGLVSRGQVINGVCFKCGGDGKHRPSQFAHPSRGRKVVQFVIVSVDGCHLAINTDRAKLEAILSSIPGAVAIEEYKYNGGE